MPSVLYAFFCNQWSMKTTHCNYMNRFLFRYTNVSEENIVDFDKMLHSHRVWIVALSIHEETI